jgi:hypothetical protein
VPSWHALRVRLESWAQRETEALTGLQQALAAATTELIVLHGFERELRIKEAEARIAEVIDLEHLSKKYYGQRLGGGALPSLAEHSYAVIAVDKSVGYSNGRYDWNRTMRQSAPDLLQSSSELQGVYDRLSPLIRKG